MSEHLSDHCSFRKIKCLNCNEMLYIFDKEEHEELCKDFTCEFCSELIRGQQNFLRHVENCDF